MEPLFAPLQLTLVEVTEVIEYGAVSTVYDVIST